MCTHWSNIKCISKTPMKKEISVVATGILFNKSYCLFLKRANKSSWGRNKWQFPGGKMEWGEEPEETLRREILEETGLKQIKKLNFLGVSVCKVKSRNKHYHVLRLLYTGKIENNIKLSPDHTSFAFFPLKQSLSQPLSMPCKKLVKYILDKGWFDE